MLKFKVLGFVTVLLGVGVAVADYWYIPKLRTHFAAIEKERLEVANRLTTARIIQENLNHVRDLIFSNMIIPGVPQMASVETEFFMFVTESVQDLKLNLVSLKPIAPKVDGRVTSFPYEIEVEGDFFKFGELCSKLENNRRIIALSEFEVTLVQPNDDIDVRILNQNQPVRIKMRIETYQVQ
jgi:Tfp pilus assembly protein PilO